MTKLNRLLKTQNSEQSKDKITNLMENIGLATRLSKLNLKKEDINLIIEKGFNPARVKNNPRQLSEDNLRGILNSIY